MPQRLIKRGDYSPISAHFNTHEFYCKSVDAPLFHPLATELIDAAEYLRNHYGVRWRITSSFRTALEERQILEKLGVPFFVDEHMKGEAIDSQPESNQAAIMADLTVQFLQGGSVYQHLRQTGINGFGLYDTFIHLDVRKGQTPHADAFGRCAHWDSRRNNASSPWGVAFSNQKKSSGGTIGQKPNRTQTPNPNPNPPASSPRLVWLGPAPGFGSLVASSLG